MDKTKYHHLYDCLLDTFLTYITPGWSGGGGALLVKGSMGGSGVVAAVQGRRGLGAGV